MTLPAPQHANAGMAQNAGSMGSSAAQEMQPGGAMAPLPRPSFAQYSPQQAAATGQAAQAGGSVAGAMPYATPFQAQAPSGQGSWQPQQQAQGGGPWQPQWGAPQQQGYAPQGGGGYQQPQQQQAPTPPPQPQGSIAQQALGGGPGQTQSFLQALQQAGAGANNSFLASPSAPQQQAPTPLLGGPAQSNGAASQYGYAGGFNTGQAPVSYNNGLGASGGSVQQGAMSPGASTSGQLQYSPSPQQSYTPLRSLGGASQQQMGNALAGLTGPSPSLAPQLQTPAPPPPQSQLQSAWNTNRANQAGSVGYGGQVGFGVGRAGTGGNGAGLQEPTGAPNYPTASSPYTTATPSRAGLFSAVSDERAKTEIRPAKEKLTSFLDAIGAHSYEYRDTANGEGRYVSPMAQELERTELGRASVVEGDDGLKHVEYGRLTGVTLAAQSLLHQRQKELNARLMKLEARGDRGR